MALGLAEIKQFLLQTISSLPKDIQADSSPVISKSPPAVGV